MPSLSDEYDFVISSFELVEGEPVEEGQDKRHLLPWHYLDNLHERRRQENDQERVVAPVVTWM